MFFVTLPKWLPNLAFVNFPEIFEMIFEITRPITKMRRAFTMSLYWEYISYKSIRIPTPLQSPACQTLSKAFLQQRSSGPLLISGLLLWWSFYHHIQPLTHLKIQRGHELCS